MKHGGAKLHGSLASKPTTMKRVQINTRRKPKTIQKRRANYTLKKSLQPFKRKLIQTEKNTSDIGVIKSFMKCNKFIKAFLKKYDSVMNSNNEEKRSNYSLFAIMLATNISSVVKEYDSLVNNNSLQSNSENISLEPEKYLEDFLEYIKEEDILEKFANIVIKYYGTRNKNNYMNLYNMNLNNNMNNNTNNINDEYLEYYRFIHDTTKAVIDTIKEYSQDLKTKRKIAENTNIDALIMGLTAVKLKGANNQNNLKDAIKNIELDEDFFSKFSKLGL